MVYHQHNRIVMNIFISLFLTTNAERELKVLVRCVEIQGGRSIEYREQTTIKLLGKGEIK